jgi:hypothetical protein
MSDKYASLSPYVYCADNPVKLVDPNGEEIGEPPLDRIVNLGFQSKTFRKLFRKAGLTTKNMYTMIKFGDHSDTDPHTKEITIRRTGSDIEKVIALTHEMTNRINSKELKKNQEDVGKGVISPDEYSDNVLQIESEGVVNQIIVAAELDYSFPDNTGLMNDLKRQYKEGTLRRREILKTIKNSVFQDEFGRDAKQQYYEQGKDIRNAQLQREKQSEKGF